MLFQKQKKPHNTTRFLFFFLVNLALTGISTIGNAAETTAVKPIMGAIRWDNWTKGNENEWQAKVLDGRSTWSPFENLQDIKWADRLPFFSKVVSENPRRIDIYEDSPEVMEQEIAFAKQSALDYWAFLYYQDKPEMNRSLDLYRINPKRDDIHYAIILAGTKPYNNTYPWENQINMMVSYATQLNYQRVLDGRPLVYIYLSDTIVHTPSKLWGSVELGHNAIDLFRSRFQQAGLGNPYIVAMNGNAVTGNTYRLQLGLDAITAYTTFDLSKPDYNILSNSNVTWWNWAASTGTPIVLPFSCGWGGPRPGGEILQQPTSEQFKQHVRTASSWIDEHPVYSPSHAVLMYAWNEFDEGGFICPTQGEKSGDRKIDWLRTSLTTVSSHNNIFLKPLNYSITNGVLKFSAIEGSRQLSIYSVTGCLYNQLTITDSYSTPLSKGIYIVKVDGSASAKAFVY